MKTESFLSMFISRLSTDDSTDWTGLDFWPWLEFVQFVAEGWSSWLAKV